MNKLCFKVTPNYFFDIAFSIMIFVFLIFILSEIGFALHISLNYAYVPISLLASFFYLFKKEADYDKKLLIPPLLIVAIISIASALYFYDYTIDGRLYHLECVMSMKEGWNPIYDNEIPGIRNDIVSAIIHQANYYPHHCPKFCEIVGANFVLFFKYLEASKIVNYLLFFELFFISVFTLTKLKNLPKHIIGLVSVAICANPVILCQLTSNCADGNFCVLFCNFLFSLFLKNKVDDKDQKFVDLLFIMALLTGCNIKMTGLVYFVAFLISYYLYCRLMCKKEQYKNFLKIVVVSVFLFVITMINPYFTNIINEGNMFFPMMGSPELNRLQRIETATTTQYLDHGHLYRTFYGIFGAPQTDQIRISPESLETRVALKVPFTRGPAKILFHSSTDFCGFGYLWSGIFVLYFLYLVFNLKAANEEKWLLLILFFSVFFNPSNHWSRYAPQFWLLPVFSMALFFNDKTITIFKKVFLYAIFVCILINNVIIVKSNLELSLYYKDRLNDIFYGSGKNLYLYFNRTPERERRFGRFFIVESSVIFEQLRERKIDFKIASLDLYEQNWEKFSLVPFDMRRQTQYMRSDLESDDVITYSDWELHYPDER